MAGFSVYIPLGGGELLHLENYRDLLRFGITPEQEVLSRHFAYFGSVPEKLLKRVNNDAGRKLLKDMSELADDFVKNNPERRFLY